MVTCFRTVSAARPNRRRAQRTRLSSDASAQKIARRCGRPVGAKKMPKHRIFTTEFSKVYPLYVQKAERKNRTKDEVDQIICWLTGYSQAGLKKQIEATERS